MTVTFLKWSKYQVDDSAERTRSWRQRHRNGDGTLPSHGDATTPSQPKSVTVQEVDKKRKDKDVDSKPEDGFGELDHKQKQPRAFELLKQVTAKIGRQPDPPAADEAPF
jgi:transposase-like protein